MFIVSQQKFSLAVSGNGLLLPQFVELLKCKYPQVVIYDRNEEANQAPSNHLIPAHPKVADIDVVFVRNATRESVTVRNRERHKYFNYVVEPAQVGLELILKQMVEAVDNILQQA